MAQQVVPVPNPKFQTGGLQTVAPTIVSHRTVKIPATFATTYTGQRITPDGLASSSTTMKFNIASNEDFLDLNKFILCFDVTWIGPNPKATVGANAHEYGLPLNLTYDQSIQSFIAQITWGSPQGMKFEEIQNYNLFANMIAQHTESSMHKERNFLDYSEFIKEQDKPSDIRKLFDGKMTFREYSRIRIGERTRVFLRFHHSSWLNNQSVIPLFLLRNGVECQILLESPHKMVHFGTFAGSSNDLVVNCSAAASTVAGDEIPNYYIGNGITTVNASGTVTRVAHDAIALNASIPYFKNNLGRVNTNNALEEAPSLNTVWIKLGLAHRILEACGYFQRPTVMSRKVYAVPVSFYELGTIVWSGFFLVDPTSHTSAGSLKHLIDTCGNFNATAVLGNYATAFTALTDARFEVGNTSAIQATPTTATNIIIPALAVASATCAGNENTGVQLYDAARSLAIASVPQIDIQDRVAYVKPLLSALSAERTAALNIIGNASKLVLGFPLYSLNDREPVPYITPGATNTSMSAAADLLAANNSIYERDGQMVVHLGDIVPLSVAHSRVPDGTHQRFIPENPVQNGLASILAMWTVNPNNRKVAYKIEKAEMMMRLLKPTSEEFAKWQSMFQQPSGIPIKMNSVIYRKQSVVQSAGQVQINLPVSVRSLKQIFFVIQDSCCDVEPANALNALCIPSLSTFQSRRLTRYEVIVGGQQYPIYPLDLLDTSYTNTRYGEDHIPELEAAFGVSGNASFNASFSKAGYKQIRNMLAGGYLNQNINNVHALYSAATTSQRCCYVDTASKVFAMSICKDDVNSFATGIDSSQSGAISMNLYFNDKNLDVVSKIFQSDPRPMDVHIFAICDRVVTLQEAANLARQ